MAPAIRPGDHDDGFLDSGDEHVHRPRGDLTADINANPVPARTTANYAIQQLGRVRQALPAFRQYLIEGTPGGNEVAAPLF